MKKKMIAVSLSAVLLASQSLLAFGSGTEISSVKSANADQLQDLNQWVSDLPAQLSDEENLALDQLESALNQLVSWGFLADSSEGQQLVALIEDLIGAIRARNGGEVLEKGNELLILVGKIASNSEFDIRKGFDSVRRLVDAIQTKDSKAAAAAITDIALLIARLAKVLNP
jgi:hypothetical protein